MSTHLGSNRLALPPPTGARHVHGAPARRADGATPPARFPARVAFAAVAIVLAAGIVLAAPLTVTLPIAFVLLVGLPVGAMLALGDRWLTRRAAMPRSAGAFGRSPATARHERPTHRRAGAADWRGLAALAVASLALLFLALFAGESVRVALSFIGLAGLIGLRLVAAHREWVPWVPVRATSGRVPSATAPHANRRVSP